MCVTCGPLVILSNSNIIYTYSSSIQLLFILQKRCICFILNEHYLSHSNPFFGFWFFFFGEFEYDKSLWLELVSHACICTYKCINDNVLLIFRQFCTLRSATHHQPSQSSNAISILNEVKSEKTLKNFRGDRMTPPVTFIRHLDKYFKLTSYLMITPFVIRGLFHLTMIQCFDLSITVPEAGGPGPEMRECDISSINQLNDIFVMSDKLTMTIPPPR